MSHKVTATQPMWFVCPQRNVAGAIPVGQTLVMKQEVELYYTESEWKQRCTILDININKEEEEL